jgi:hypothetical protein
VPLTSTESPTLTVIAAPDVNTNRPDDAEVRVGSGDGCWIQNPLLLPAARTPVTIPATLLTAVPFSGEMNPSPWMSWIVVEPGTHSGGSGVSVQSGPVGTTAGAAFGVGVATVKSALLTPVLANGAILRCADVLLPSPPAGEKPAPVSVAAP